MLMRTRRFLIASLLGCALALWVLPGSLDLAMAQQQPPTSTTTGAVPTLTPVLPAPMPNPTRSPIEMVPGASEEVAIWKELWQQFGLFGTLFVGLIGAVLVILFGFFRKTVEGLVGFAYQLLIGRWFDQHVRDRDTKNQEERDRLRTHKARQSSLTVYFDWLQEELKHLPVIPIRSTERQEQLLLQDVYVPLRVVERVQIEGFRRLLQGDFDPAGEYQVRQEAFDALAGSRGVYRLLSEPEQLIQREAGEVQQQRGLRPTGLIGSGETVEMTTTRLLLIGDAGSGKTTTLQYGALLLAHDSRSHTTDTIRKHLDLHTTVAPVPFYIRLTLVATYVREAQQRARQDELPGLQGAASKLLLDWLDSYTAAQVTTRGVAIARDVLSHQIAAGGCLIMLDGLDETGDTSERDYMQRLIENLVQDYPKNRYLVASRPFEDLHLLGFEERHLSPLNRDEMKRLLRNWFGAVRKSYTPRSNETVTDQVAYLYGILEQNARLFEMATNPLLLTSMALLVHTGVGLPRERAELYHRFIVLLLDTWRTQQIMGGVPGRDDRRTRYGGEESASGVQRRLQSIAAWMQEHGRREVRLHEAQQILRSVYKELKRWDNEQADDYVAIMLESLALESGLMQRRDGGYSFAHYTLQEYLTARAYDLRPDSVQALHQNWSKPRWRETILLAVGHWATGGQPEKARQLLQMLLDDPSDNTMADDALQGSLIGMRGLQADQVDALLLAAQALDDADADRVVELALLRNTTVARLRACAFQSQAYPDPVVRNRAATMLDRLDADVDRPSLDLSKADYWAARIEPGTFSMGDDHGAYDNEKPQFDYAIKQPYALGRFPVTNRQYLLFIEAMAGRGTPEAIAAAQKLLPLMKQHEQTPEQFRPGFWPSARYRAGEGNHPVVGVTWYAATAFAWWVNETVLTPEQRANGEAIRLPTEAEWERAAAYPVLRSGNTPRDGRRDCPWGDGVAVMGGDRIRSSIEANIRESEIGSTSVVGIFPHGAAVCGAEEMGGNVWEWCSTPAVAYPFRGEVIAESLYTGNKSVNSTYVLRGGSWRGGHDNARCAYRLDFNPTFDYSSLGLRLARLFSWSLSS